MAFKETLDETIKVLCNDGRKLTAVWLWRDYMRESKGDET